MKVGPASRAGQTGSPNLLRPNAVRSAENEELLVPAWRMFWVGCVESSRPTALEVRCASKTRPTLRPGALARLAAVAREQVEGHQHDHRQTDGHAQDRVRLNEVPQG